MTRPTSAERARRLIALLSYLQREGRAKIGPLARDLGIDVADLAEDLVTLSMCGVAPYDPLALVPVMVSGDEFEVFGDLPAVSGSIRLSVSEANALVAALQAAGLDSDTGLTERLLGAVASAPSAENIGGIVRASIEGHDTGVYKTLADAIDRHSVALIDHAGAEQFEAWTREVEPTALFAERGMWYLRAWCRAAGDWRTFRLDRIVDATATNEIFEPRKDHMQGSYEALELEKLPVATLRFSAEQPFDEREWPGGRITESADDEGSIVEVPYAGESWMSRHVAACLGYVEVLAPQSLRVAVAALASSELAEPES